MIPNRLVTFHLDNLIGSTNGLDPTNLKRGRVRTQRPVGIDASANGLCKRLYKYLLNVGLRLCANVLRML